MKKFALTFVLVCACTALIYAGPEPMASKEVAPVPAPPPSCFEGWYFGIHGGGIWANLDTRTAAFEQTISPLTGELPGVVDTIFDSTGKRDETSWEAGLHGGYNWQRGGWVFGLELDIQGTDLRRNASASDFFLLPPGETFVYTTEINSKVSLDWYGTGRVRIGHTLGDRIMVFATGGGAVGLTEVSESTDVFATTTEGGAKTAFLTKSNRDIRGGWTGGGGIDFCLSQHWMLNFTYLYVDLGDSSVSSAAVLTLPARFGDRTFDSVTRTRADFQFHVFQGGLTFHF